VVPLTVFHFDPHPDVSAWRTTARRQVCWQGRADCSMVPQLLDVEMGHVISWACLKLGIYPKMAGLFMGNMVIISQNGCFLWEI